MNATPKQGTDAPHPGFVLAVLTGFALVLASLVLTIAVEL